MRHGRSLRKDSLKSSPTSPPSKWKSFKGQPKCSCRNAANCEPAWDNMQAALACKDANAPSGRKSCHSFGTVIICRNLCKEGSMRSPSRTFKTRNSR